MRLDDYALLIGPNNSGKSTAMYAILAFYEKDGYRFTPDRDTPATGTDDGDSWVEIEYELTDDEIESLKKEYRQPHGKLRLRKYFRSRASTIKLGYIHVVSEDGVLSADSFYGAKNVQDGKIGDIIFIPAVSKVDEHTKLTGPSALRDMVSDIVKDVTSESDAYKALVEDFSRFATDIKDHVTPDDRSLARLENTINSDLAPWGISFSIDIQHPQETELLKNLTHYSFNESKIGLEGMAADVFGSGFQRHFIYTLIRLRSEYIPKKKQKKTKGFSPSMVVLLFEEPEAFLHPPQQSALSRNLQKLGQEEGRQVVCSTHSAHFVSLSADSITSIVRVRRDADGVIGLHQLSPEKWLKIADKNQAINVIAKKYRKMAKNLSGDDMEPEMEAIKHALWLNPDRSTMFFADHVLIVEGATEVGFINKLMGEGRIDAPPGVYVLDAMGKYNIHRFMNLLSSLCISHSVLHDDDNNHGEHLEINSLIKETGDDEFTKYVTSIKGNIEQLLGVRLTNSTHRKPQHLLYCYDQGRVDEKNVEIFCGIVCECLGIRAGTEGSEVGSGK